MAFDGPGPFDGDPAFDFWTEFEEADEDAEAIIEDALAAPIESAYLDVDGGVAAWIAAELVAHFSGRPGEALPDNFAGITVKDVSDLAALARESLGMVAITERSELAELWAERGEGPLADRLADLCERLDEVMSGA